MNEPATRRPYFSVQRILTRISASILVAFLIAVVASSTTFADDTYLTWQRLFNNPDPIPPTVYISNNSSTFTKNGWFLDTTNKTIIGPRFIFDFTFPSGNTGTNTQYTWGHIPAPDGNYPVFILRSCDVGTGTGGIDEASCIYSEINYKENAAAINGGTFWSNYWVQLAQSLNSPSGALAAQVTNALNAIGDATNALVILRKNSNGNYVSHATQDILGTKWFKMTAPGTAIKVDWLQRPDQKVSLWYRGDKLSGGGGQSNTVDPDEALDDGTDTIKNWYTAGSVKNSFFKIGEVPLTKPASYESAAAESNTDSINANRDVEQSTLPECSFLVGGGSFMGCIARLIYYVIYWPIAWFAGLMGNLFDFFLGYSLQDASYRANFAVQGWKIVRDISNIFFIIILVWTGLSTVFGFAKMSMKQVVPNLILNALLINFSLFATRVIIDISNVVARVFYHSVEVCDGKCSKNADGSIANPKQGIAGFKPLSEKIVSAFNPQKIFSAQILSQSKSLPTPTNAAASAKENPNDKSSSAYAGYFIVVSLIAALILFTIAMMFWKTAFFFLGRVIGLYVAMIFAPFAFLSRKMPLIGDFKQISWENWFADLTKYAMLAPIFVFFLYIIYALLESDFMSTFSTKSTGVSFFETVIYIAIPMLIVYFMIKKGVDIAEKYAGDIGKQVQGIATGVVGATALGVASGGLASVARGTLGRASSMLANSNTMRKWSGSNNWLARQVGNTGVKIGESGSKATYDIRGTGLLKQAGIDSGKESKFISKLTRTSTDNTKGGVVGSIDRKEKRRYERMKTFQLSGDMAAAQDAKAKAWEQTHIDPALTNWKNNNPNLANDSFSVEQEKQRLMQVQAQQGNVAPKSSKEINLQRNKDYADRVKKDSLVSKAASNIFGIQGGVAGTAGAIGASAGAGILGGALSAVSGEMATSSVADTRVSGNIGRLNAHDAAIANLTALIAPLQVRLLTGVPAGAGVTPTSTPPLELSKAEAEQLKNLKAKLKDEQTKRDALNERLTKKD